MTDFNLHTPEPDKPPNRCRSLAPVRSGMYRCIMESNDGHTEHHYNYYRALTPSEKQLFWVYGGYEDDST